MLGTIAIDEPANRAAGRVINTGHAARTDRDKLALLRCRAPGSVAVATNTAANAVAHKVILDFMDCLLLPLKDPTR